MRTSAICRSATPPVRLSEESREKVLRAKMAKTGTPLEREPKLDQGGEKKEFLYIRNAKIMEWVLSALIGGYIMGDSERDRIHCVTLLTVT